jgi:hypothetical protein
VFAAAQAAPRSLAQSLARQLGPEGIHVSLVIVDGMIGDPGAAENDPKTRALRPEALAGEVFHLTQQDRSAWTFELDLTPQHESW